MSVKNLGKNFYAVRDEINFPQNLQRNNIFDNSFSTSRTYETQRDWKTPKYPFNPPSLKPTGLSTIFESSFSDSNLGSEIITKPERNIDYFSTQNKNYFWQSALDTQSQEFKPPREFLAEPLTGWIGNKFKDPQISEDFVNNKELNFSDKEKAILLDPPPYVPLVRTEFYANLPPPSYGDSEENKLLNEALRYQPVSFQDKNFFPAEPDLNKMRKNLVQQVASNASNIVNNVESFHTELDTRLEEVNVIINNIVSNFIIRLRDVQENNFTLEIFKEETKTFLKTAKENYFNRKVNEIIDKINNQPLSQDSKTNIIETFRKRCEQNYSNLNKILVAMFELKYSQLLIIVEKEKQIDRLRIENSKLFDQINEIKSKVDQMKENSNNPGFINEEYRKAIEKIENQDLTIKRLNDEISNSSAALEEQKLAFDQIFREKTELNAQIELLNLRNNETLQGLNARISELTTANENISRLYQNLPIEIDMAVQEKNYYIAEYSKNQQELTNLRAQYLNQSQNYENYIQDLNAKYNQSSDQYNKAIELLKVNENKIRELQYENDMIKQNEFKNNIISNELAQEILMSLGIDINSSNVTVEVRESLKKLFLLKNEVEQLQKNTYEFNQVKKTHAMEMQSLRGKLSNAQEKNNLLTNEIEKEKLKLSTLKNEKIEIEKTLELTSESLENLNSYTVSWSSTITALTIFIDEASERVDTFYNDWISPFYSFFSKRNGILGSIKYFGEQSPNLLNAEIPQSPLQKTFPHSAMVAFFQLYFAALVKNMENVKGIFILQHKKWFTEMGFIEDPFEQENLAINIFLNEVNKHDAVLQEKASKLRNDDDRNNNLISIGRTTIDSFKKNCSYLLETIASNRKKLEDSQIKLGKFINSFDENIPSFINIVLNLYQNYLACSPLNNFFFNMAYTYFIELFELILIEDKFSNPNGVNLNVTIKTYKERDNFKIKIEGYDNWSKIGLINLQKRSIDLLNVTVLQLTISPVGVLAKCKLMLRNYMISLNYGIGENKSFSHSFSDCILLENFFWKLKKIGDNYSKLTNCLERLGCFTIGNSQQKYILDDLNSKVLSDCIENLSKEVILIFFYEFISKTLLWIIQKIHSEIYFATPNSFVITQIINLIDQGMFATQIEEILKNLFYAHREIIKMIAIGLIKPNAVLANYTPLEEDKSLVGKALLAYNDREKIFQEIMNSNQELYLANEYFPMITNPEPYKKRAFIDFIKKDSAFRCLPLINYFINLKNKNTWDENAIAPNISKLDKTTFEFYPKNRFPYEFLMDNSDVRHIENANHTYDINRKFSYFMCFNYILGLNMAIKGNVNLADVSLNLTTKANISKIYQETSNIAFNNPLMNIMNKIRAAVSSQDLPAPVRTQKILKTVINKEITKNTKINSQAALPDLIHEEVKDEGLRYAQKEIDSEENKSIDLIRGAKQALKEGNIPIIRCKKSLGSITNINQELYGILNQKLANEKKNKSIYTIKPFVNFMTEISKYIQSNYLK